MKFQTPGNLWLPLIGLVCACSGNGNDDPDGGADASAWQVIQEERPGAILSVWGTGSDDVWLCGANGGDGPEALRLRDGLWESLDTGVSNDLWWVFGPNASEVWFVGADGVILRYDRSTETFTNIVSPTDATLFGVWGPPAGPLYAVGGYIEPASGPPVVVRIEGDTATLATDLPAGLDLDEAFFKVWGTASDDVWVIGDRGSVLHFDGTWARTVLPNRPRLVTLHGRSQNDMVVVGGAGQGVLYERVDGGPWQDATLRGRSALNGVFVAADGRAAAVGMSNSVLERKDGYWKDLPAPEVWGDWHGVWIDERGDITIVGGNLLGLSKGTVLRYRAQSDSP